MYVHVRTIGAWSMTTVGFRYVIPLYEMTMKGDMVVQVTFKICQATWVLLKQARNNYCLNRIIMSCITSI